MRTWTISVGEIRSGRLGSADGSRAGEWCWGARAGEAEKRIGADSVGILSHTYAGVKPHSQARGASACCGCGLEKPSAGLEAQQEEGGAV